MIHELIFVWESFIKMSVWQDSIKNMVTDVDALFEYLRLDNSMLAKAKAATTLFPLRVTHSYLQRINKNDINDPLLKQILPMDAEFAENKSYKKDPLNEAGYNPVPGLLHKYHGRVLLTLSPACAIHCRYCFRRHFPYLENNPNWTNWQKVFAYISNDPSISEVIYSGGDPLMANDKFLKALTSEIAAIKHIKYLRIHTRLPIVVPNRINDEFMSWIKNHPLKTTIVIHCNHANEINHEVKTALAKLTQSKITLFNQSVLLKGVNDSVVALASLSETLFAAGVLPYYLHMPDKVQGTAHFDVCEQRAKELHLALQRCLPGYLVPKLVREIDGFGAKQVLS